jgi:hypothetical protein
MSYHLFVSVTKISVNLWTQTQTQNWHLDSILKNVLPLIIIVWQLDLQLPMQSVLITTKVVISNFGHGEVCSIQHYVIKFVSDLRQFEDFFLSTLVSSTNKTDCHNINEILLKVALNTKILTNSRCYKIEVSEKAQFHFYHFIHIM